MGVEEREVEAREILDGFLYAYRQMDMSAVKLFDASAHVYALVELLISKGIIGIDELDERKRAVEKRLNANFKQAEIGVRVRRDEVDKYAMPGQVEIDCENRMHLCHGICCSFAFPLTMQDIKEGIRWSLGRPFLNARGDDGYCVKWDHVSHRCGIYEHRPAVCREYDCRQDSRVWLDFDKMIINPELSPDTKPGDAGEAQTEETGGESVGGG